jgi:uncharacterized membrane protein
VEEAAKLVISAGLVEPGSETVPVLQPEDVDKLNSASNDQVAAE